MRGAIKGHKLIMGTGFSGALMYSNAAWASLTEELEKHRKNIFLANIEH